MPLRPDFREWPIYSDRARLLDVVAGQANPQMRRRSLLGSVALWLLGLAGLVLACMLTVLVGTVGIAAARLVWAGLSGR